MVLLLHHQVKVHSIYTKGSYDVGVAETEEALRAEVSEVCRNYCFQV